MKPQSALNNKTILIGLALFAATHFISPAWGELPTDTAHVKHYFNVTEQEKSAILGDRTWNEYQGGPNDCWTSTEYCRPGSIGNWLCDRTPRHPTDIVSIYFWYPREDKYCWSFDCQEEFAATGVCEGQEDPAPTPSPTPPPRCRITMNSHNGNIEPGGITLIAAEVSDSVTNVDWHATTEAGTANADITPAGIIDKYAYAKISGASGKGTLKITAVAETPQSICRDETTVRVGNDCDRGCTGEDCGGPGEATIKNGSVDVSFSLGKADDGFPAGELFIYADTWSDELATPKALRPAIYTSNGRGTWSAETGMVKAFSGEIHVKVEVENDHAYEIHFYKAPTNRPPFVIWRVENPVPGTARLDITEIRGEKQTVNSYAYNDTEKTWTLSTGNGLRVSTKREFRDGEDRIVRETVTDSSGLAASFSETVNREFPWGEAVVRKTAGDGPGSITEDIAYYTNAGEPGYSKVKSRRRSDGSWNKYYYDTEGRLIRKVTPWLDTDFDAPETEAFVVTYDYTPVAPDDDDSEIDSHRPRTITETANGTLVSKTFYAYEQGNRTTETTKRCVTPDAGWDDPDNLTTRTDYYLPATGRFEAGKIMHVTHPDGRHEWHHYQHGYWHPENDQYKFAWHDAGFYIRKTVIRGSAEKPNGIDGKTTHTSVVYDRYGNKVMETEAASPWGIPYWWKIYENDEFGRPERIYYSDGTEEEIGWDCCNRDWAIDRNGIFTDLEYDDLNRLRKATRENVGTMPQQTIEYEYDGEGRERSRTVTAGGLSHQTSTEYHTSGRLMETADRQGRKTEYGYEANGLKTVVTLPGGATETTQTYPDGHVRSVTGTATVPKSYEYGVYPNGWQWTKTTTGSGPSATWETAVTDMLGRTIWKFRPGHLGSSEAVSYEYNTSGQLTSRSIPGTSSRMVFEYDEIGNLVRQGIDVNGNGVLDDDSADRITETEYAYKQDATGVWLETAGYVHSRNAQGAAEKLRTGLRRERLGGFGAEGLIAEIEEFDAANNVTYTRTYIDRAAKTETVKITHWDSDTVEEIGYVGGLVDYHISKTGHKTDYGHDPLGRLDRTLRPRMTKQDIIEYFPDGTVNYTEDASGLRTTFTYYPDGNVKTKTAGGNVTRYAYNGRGQVTHVWGNAVKPAEYVYDEQGRLLALHTFRKGDGFDGGTWPEGNSPDTTTWHYEDGSGLLTGKADAAGNTVTYAYEPGSHRLATRTAARTENGVKIVTRYGYDKPTGDLANIFYSDNTPDLAFKHDRLGRPETVTDAFGTRTFIYNGLFPHQENITGLRSELIRRDYHRGHPWKFGAYGPGPDYELEYGYDTKGRPETVSWSEGTAARTATYAYRNDADLLDRVYTDNGFSTTYDYQPDLNFRSQIRNQLSGKLISQYDYTPDELGRVKTEKRRGYAINRALTLRALRPQRLKEDWLKNAENLSAGVTMETDYREYTYDHIGNRERSVEWRGRTWQSKGELGSSVYTPNSLNQYDPVTHSDGTRTDMQYDADGNLTRISGETRYVADAYGDMPPRSGKVCYRYDAENRLIEATPESPGIWDKKVAFAYDYMGRRIRKTVDKWQYGAWVREKETLFIYDGWNVVKEIVTENNAERQFWYVWGHDMSGAFQGAGGVGGLIARLDTRNLQDMAPAYYCYAGNGNVSQLVSPATGEVVAHYAYDPFGNITFSFGELADANPFRFSTKWFDDETGLIAYPRRYYLPELGIWTSKDPLGELGGLNLYAFAFNNPLNLFDPLGLACDLQSVFETSLKSAAWDFAKNFAAKKAVKTVAKAGASSIIPVIGPAIGIGLSAWSAYSIGKTALEVFDNTDKIRQAVTDFYNDPEIMAKIECLSEEECDLLAEELGVVIAAAIANKKNIKNAVKNIKDVVKKAATSKNKLSDLKFASNEFQFADSMSDKSFTKLVKDIRENGIHNKTIKYVEIDGVPYIVHGNNRFMALRYLNKLDELQFQKVDLPVEGTNYRTVQDVLETIGTVRQPRYRGR